MNCRCGGKYMVIDTRGTSEIYRRRKCFKCGKMICTVEKKVDYIKGMDLINGAYWKIRRKKKE